MRYLLVVAAALSMVATLLSAAEPAAAQDNAPYADTPVDAY